MAAESLQRYSSQTFPPYAFIPGKHPHPRRNPKGHSYGRPEPAPPAFGPAQWRRSEDYRYALDLYNFGYWWECHEVLEGLWHAVGTKTEQGSFFQALIDLAAGNMKQRMGKTRAAYNLWSRSLTRLEKLPSPYMGLDLRAFVEDLQASLTKPTPPLLIRLNF